MRFLYLHEDRILAEQLRLVHANFSVALSGACGAALLLAVGLSACLRSGAPLVWFLFVTALALALILLIRRQAARINNVGLHRQVLILMASMSAFGAL